MITKNKILKTATLTLVAATLAETSNAWFWSSSSEREMRMTPEGVLIPARKEGWLAKATTYHEELKPRYNPETQRVEQPVYGQYVDGVRNENTPTIKPAWYDRMTTYHEEDRRPWNPYDTVSKDIPAYMYYDKKEARLYNEHYNQEGLKPVPYMYGSASLVLRKEKDADKLVASLEGQSLDGINQIGADPMDSRIVGMDNNVYIRPAGGFESVDQRGSMNDMQEIRSNYISMSDPVSSQQRVTNYNSVMIGDPKKSDVQAKTKIADANVSWRDKLTQKVDMSRPGDFDYKAPEKTLAKPYTQQSAGGFEDGEVIAGADGREMPHNNYNAYAASGKVNNYVVENGDTLSEISDKEKIYGDWTLWPLIYDANRNQVNDPDLIRPGQDLDIPRDYNTTEEDDARYRAKNREMPISLYDGQ